VTISLNGPDAPSPAVLYAAQILELYWRIAMSISRQTSFRASHRHRRLVGAGLVCAFALAACGGGMMMIQTNLTGPQEDGILLIGSVIVGEVGEVRRQEPLAVYIAGDVEQEGGTARVGFTVIPDADGYFAIENAPPGNYVLKGVQYGRGGVPSWLIWHPMRYGTDRWQRQEWSMVPAFTGEIDPARQRGRVVDFGHNIFIVSTSSDVQQIRRNTINGETFDLNASFDRPLVAEYFLQRFPGSGWTEELRALIGRNR
jgi:hypothetical protein